MCQFFQVKCVIYSLQQLKLRLPFIILKFVIKEMFKEANRTNFADWLVDLVQKSHQNTNPAQAFEWKTKMKATPFDLIQRLQHCLNLSDQILVSGLCLMKRAISHNLKLTPNSIYKLAVVCIFIAHKFYSDFHHEIEDFSIASGVSIKDLNQLESIALDILDYSLIISERDYYGVLFFRSI